MKKPSTDHPNRPEKRKPRETPAEAELRRRKAIDEHRREEYFAGIL